MGVPNSYMLRVSCMTYNQSAYITDALNGFVMQQTDFPFVCTIVDDASTDGEQEIIKKYMQEHFDLQDSFVAYDKEMDYGHVTFAQHKTNKNCYFAVIYLKENHYSQRKSKAPYLTKWMDTKYIAFCEGDDYWIEPLKLQKQVDFLERHPDYSLCCHRYKVYNQDDETWGEDYVKKLFEETPNGFSFGNKENLNTWITKTLTLMCRCDCCDNSDLVKYKYRCDEHLNYHLLKKGMGYCFPFVGGVYRRCNTGIFSVLSEKERLVRWCRIRYELLEWNMYDQILRDSVYFTLRRHLYYGNRCREMIKLACLCIRSLYLTEGNNAALIGVKKIVGFYFKGLGNRAK